MFKVSRRAFAAGVGAAAPLVGFMSPINAQSGRNVLVGGFDTGPGGQQGNFNPLTATAGFTWLNLYFEPLAMYDVKLEKISPALASSIDVSADKLALTFKLPTNAKWHDGAPVTSADVRFTIELAKNKNAGSIFVARLGDIASVEAPDPATAVVRLSKPNPGLLDTLTKILILPKHKLETIAAEQIAKHEWWSTAPVGTGPFAFVKYETDQYVELKANPDYRRGKPALDGVINRYFKNTAGAVAALRSGEIQFTYVESDDVKTFNGKPDFSVIAGDSYVLNYIGFNHATPFWKDERVRRAVMHAINRDAIIKSLYEGAAKAADTAYVAPHLVPGDMEKFAYDPAKARQLLKDAGWEAINGAKPLNWLTYYNSPQVANVMAAMQAMLAQVGINVTPKPVETATFNATVYAANPDHSQFPLIYAGLQNGPDPGSLNVGLNGKQLPPTGANITRADFPELSGAFDAALGESDDAKRAEKYQAVSKSFNKILPWAPMWVATRYGVVSNRVGGFVWTPAPGGGGYAPNAEKWTLRG